ncbi:MAG: hypothetical protein R2795_09535 [Saprospiraceae bacterium]
MSTDKTFRDSYAYHARYITSSFSFTVFRAKDGSGGGLAASPVAGHRYGRNPVQPDPCLPRNAVERQGRPK